MKPRSQMMLLAFAISVLLTALLHAAAVLAFSNDAETLSRVLAWPNTVLQLAVPCHDVGSANRPVCEGTPLNLIAYMASFPLAVIAYFWMVYLLLQRRNGA